MTLRHHHDRRRLSGGPRGGRAARFLALAAGLTAAVSLAACKALQQNTAPSSPVQTLTAPGSPAPAGHVTRVHDPGEVTGTERSSCHFRANGQLPDPACTPGSIDPAVTQANIGQTICRVGGGYTRTVRPPESQTQRFKFDEAYPAYDVPEGVKTELDHLVSLELGGSNDATNLWPERPPTPNHKDTVENALHHAVCSRQVTLAAAQQAIATDWLTAEARLGIGRS